MASPGQGNPVKTFHGKNKKLPPNLESYDLHIEDKSGLQIRCSDEYFHIKIYVLGSH